MKYINNVRLKECIDVKRPGKQPDVYYQINYYIHDTENNKIEHKIVNYTNRVVANVTYGNLQYFERLNPLPINKIYGAAGREYKNYNEYILSLIDKTKHPNIHRALSDPHTYIIDIRIDLLLDKTHICVTTVHKGERTIYECEG
jgi:hypothetical protein